MTVQSSFRPDLNVTMFTTRQIRDYALRKIVPNCSEGTTESMTGKIESCCTVLYDVNMTITAT